MLFERIVSEGIAHNSYLIGSGGKAAVIDPRRDCGIYRELADQKEVTITTIFETHRNEDYTIGSLELASQCGAEIYHGHALPFAYGKSTRQGDIYHLGSLELSVLETPGHTEESISLVVRDTEVSDHPYMVFCGDTLFAGDIARTDFFGQKRKAEMAGKIFDSITTRILPLGEGVIVCPAHGAGSVCGGEIADHPFTTIGYEKMTNPMLKRGRESFVSHRITESPSTPPYFAQMEINNKEGVAILHNLPRIKPVSVPELNALIHAGCQIVDIRAPTSFAAGHIPGSLSIWRDGIATFIGWFLDYQRPIILVDDFNKELEKIQRQFIRLGYDNLAGFLAGGFPSWYRNAQDTMTNGSCTVQQLNERLNHESPFILDVRDEKNWNDSGHIRGAHHYYIGELTQHLEEIPKDQPVIIYCDAGYKGSIGCSILQVHGYMDVTNVLGGIQAWKQAGFRLEK